MNWNKDSTKRSLNQDETKQRRRIRLVLIPSDQRNSRPKTSSKVKDCSYTYILPKEHYYSQCGTSNTEADQFLSQHAEDNYKHWFSSTKRWEHIPHHHDQVQWSKVIWFSQEVLRFAFIIWFTSKTKLTTCNRNGISTSGPKIFQVPYKILRKIYLIS